MSKFSKRVRNEQCPILQRHCERRAELRTILRPPSNSVQEVAEARAELSRQAGAASATKLCNRRNRDAIEGQPRRTFGRSRMHMREMAHAGQLPGVSKASW